MKRRSLIFLLFAAISAIAIASLNPSQATPLAPQASSITASEPSYSTRAGYGCGWEYSCPPRPDFGQQSHYRPGEVYIRNNYGTVNVYENRRGYSAIRPEYREGIGRYDQGVAGDPYCYGTPCERCGPICWYRRFKRGYCGHGCDIYRERVRFERARRVVEYPRPIYDRAPPPDYIPNDSGYAPPAYERPRDEEPYPRRRFEGPQYPACSSGAC
jgi:hypothetical protein